MYVCMYVCMYVRTYVRMYVCMYVCKYVKWHKIVLMELTTPVFRYFRPMEDSMHD